MREWIAALCCFAAAALICSGLLPWTIRMAPHIGAMDIPRDARRMHKHPIPRTGGIALFLAFCLCLAFSDALMPAVAQRARIACAVGAGIIVLVGVLDDVFHLSPAVKLVGQGAAAVVAVGAAQDELPLWQFLIGVVWLVLLVNAHNMVDGLDGLAASIAATEGLALCAVLALTGQWGAVAFCAVTVGCCVGFLPYNRHPARTFLGDAGSQLLGFSLGALSLEIDVGALGALGALIPLLVFALPLSDLGFAVVRRVCRGQSPFAADRGHWHHRLCDAGLGQRGVCRYLCALSAAMGGVAVLLCREEWYPFAVYLVLSVLALVSAIGMRQSEKN